MEDTNKWLTSADKYSLADILRVIDFDYDEWNADNQSNISGLLGMWNFKEDFGNQRKETRDFVRELIKKL